MSNIDEFFEIIRHEYNKENHLVSASNSHLDYEFDKEILKAVSAIKRMEAIRKIKQVADRK